MVFWSPRVKLACLVLCTGTLLVAWTGYRSPAPAAPTPAVYAAFYEGVPINLTLTAPRRGQSSFRFGPWQLGARLHAARGSDRRPNLYLVFPGDQHQAESGEECDHNAVLGAMPLEERAFEWDVYWAVVLDPALGRGLRSERDLLIAAQSRFAPNDVFEFDDLPGAGFLRDIWHWDSVQDLASYRRKDGRLPRVLIVPAGYAIRAGKAPAAAAVGS